MTSSLPKKLLSILRWGQIHHSPPETLTLSSDDLYISPIDGIFDFGLTLDQHSRPLDSNYARHLDDKRTKMGEFVYRYNYRFEKDLCFPLADIVSEIIKNDPILASAELILTVPPSFTSRPFDPMSVLAEEVSKRISILHRKDIFERTRITRLQKHLFSRKEKIENVKGAFRVKNPELVKGRRILLIDEIYDSGATLNELSRILKSSGATKVFVLILTQTGWYGNCPPEANRTSSHSGIPIPE